MYFFVDKSALMGLLKDFDIQTIAVDLVYIYVVQVHVKDLLWKIYLKDLIVILLMSVCFEEKLNLNLKIITTKYWKGHL